ncbi:hypothetical protein DMH04_18235 [Kibdelosporangium aridum]|uniref:DUF3040 domain-containing protein n=2 Tax=Kibdelosporangium aridum TaxID=2030 RepID=A0A428ZAY9_KIBAR|nr:hypothetical protein DMH04_18235 [Kibdelosporangium aridum]
MDHGHDKIVLNPYERHQLELIEHHLAEESRHQGVRAQSEAAMPNAVWFGVLLPCSWLMAGVWLLLVGSPLGLLFVVMAAVSATATLVVRDRTSTSPLRKDR